MVAKFVDSVLTADGIEGSEKALPSLDGLNLSKTILVSPLRRTIETACHLLKGHPRKSEFTLKIEPTARELMTAGNVMLCTASYLRKFCANLASEFGLKIDTTSLDKYENQDYWYLEDFLNKEETTTLQKVMDISEKVEDDQPFSEAAFARLTEHFRQYIPDDLWRESK